MLLSAVTRGAVADGLQDAPVPSPAPAPPYAGTDRRGKRAHTPEASRRARESRDALNVRAAAAQPCGDASAAETGACVHVHGPLAHALAHAGTDRRGRVRIRQRRAALRWRVTEPSRTKSTIHNVRSCFSPVHAQRWCISCVSYYRIVIGIPNRP